MRLDDVELCVHVFSPVGDVAGDAFDLTSSSYDIVFQCYRLSTAHPILSSMSLLVHRKKPFAKEQDYVLTSKSMMIRSLVVSCLTSSTILTLLNTLNELVSHASVVPGPVIRTEKSVGWLSVLMVEEQGGFGVVGVRVG